MEIRDSATWQQGFGRGTILRSRESYIRETLPTHSGQLPLRLRWRGVHLGSEGNDTKPIPACLHDSTIYWSLRYDVKSLRGLSKLDTAFTVYGYTYTLALVTSVTMWAFLVS